MAPMVKLARPGWTLGNYHLGPGHLARTCRCWVKPLHHDPEKRLTWHIRLESGRVSGYMRVYLLDIIINISIGIRLPRFA